MRIALVSPYDITVFGGVQNQVLGLSRALLGTDDVVVISPGKSSERDGVPVVGVGAVVGVRANGSVAPISIAPSAWRRTRAALRDFRPDVIHIHEPFVPLVGLAASKTGLAPAVATFHRGGAGQLYPHLAPALRPRFESFGFRAAVSEEASSTLDVVFGPSARRPTILPNAIDIDRFAAAEVVPHAGRLVVFVGRHEQRKGLRVLLEAFKAGIADTRLVVVGDGPESRRLRAEFASRPDIDFVGAVDDRVLASLVASADLFVAPSLSGESFGVVLLEAMAARTAVVASDIPGYRLAAGAAARFFPPGDVLTLRDAITELLDAAHARDVLVLAGNARAEAHSFSSLAATYRELYQSLLSN